MGETEQTESERYRFMPVAPDEMQTVRAALAPILWLYGDGDEGSYCKCGRFAPCDIGFCNFNYGEYECDRVREEILRLHRSVSRLRDGEDR